MLRNLVIRMTEKDVVKLLSAAGLEGMYIAIHVPRRNKNVAHPLNKGYCFILMLRRSFLGIFRERLEGMQVCTKTGSIFWRLTTRFRTLGWY